MSAIKRLALFLGAATLGLAIAALSGCGANSGNVSGNSAPTELTNVSYDPTRELYAAYNELFEAHWKETTGNEIVVTQSHGGSGKQALEVANGLEADVVTLALEGDVQVVADSGLIDPGFTSEFPLDSSPYTSIIVFLVRSGNPKGIHDWDDLTRDGVGVITPNPKTSGGAMWNYLAAWHYFETLGQDEAQIRESVGKIYGNVVVLDSGARGATTSFVENKQGDVLIAWENEAFLSLREYPGEYEIVIPSVSILCQPTVAVVDAVARKHGTEEAAAEYLNYLYSDEAQEVVAENFYRPGRPQISVKYISDDNAYAITEIPSDGKWIKGHDAALTNINHFGGWAEARATHFVDGGTFDQIYEG